jgi:hypothetical protein
MEGLIKKMLRNFEKEEMEGPYRKTLRKMLENQQKKGSKK